MINLGRNDPCHCGSGKKYKKCHLDGDQRRGIGVRRSPPEAESPSAWVDVKSLPKRLRLLAGQGPAKGAKQFGKLLSKVEPILEYLERQEEIEAALAELEAHRSEYEKLAADENRYLPFAQAVFAEECFAPLRFTASDVQRAFDHAGYPAMMSPDDRMVGILRAAILHLADKECRSRLATSLLLRLPEFVAAGRYLEAWILQSSAVQTTEDHTESNLFLFQMFSYGYDNWAAERQAKDQSLLRKLGIDPDRLRTMSLDELDSWICSQGSDVANAAALETFFQENPHLRQESIANLQAMERNSTQLLERPDSRFLHLPNEEVQPWLVLFNERASQQGFLSAASGPPTEESVNQMFEAVMLPLVREMADSIFTRERIRQLVTALRKYRSERFAAGDHATAGHAQGAITYLEREDSPGLNTFLLSLCGASIDSAIKATVSENRAD